MEITSTAGRKIINTSIWVCLNILEGVICFIITLLIPADPQNALFLGYSPFRLATLLIILLLLGLNVFIWVRLSSVTARLKKFADQVQPSVWKLVSGAFLAVCVWIILWFPAARFGDYEAVFIRLQPLMLWVCLLGLQFVILLSALAGGIDLHRFRNAIHDNRKALIISAGIWLTLVVVFFILRSTSMSGLHDGTDFPPGAPLAPLQLVTACCLCVVIYLLEGKVLKNRSTAWVTGILFVILWGTAILVWSGTPFTCTDDRIGPYAPNYVCYPESDDAVYSIGSHYTSLGEGIYNHWMTDKPLYMVFLAIGQWITSPMIDDYLLFQLVIIALIPGLLFILGKKWIGLSGGVFLSLLSIFLGRNALLMYQSTGSVNVRMENPELLTALLLIILIFPVFQWFTKPQQPAWPVISAGVLGLSVLVRFNPLLIAPLLLGVYVVFDFWQRKRVLFHSILFIVTFCLVICPWFLGSRDNNGQNFYLSKIQSVLLSRFNISVGQAGETLQPVVTPAVIQTAPQAVEIPEGSEQSVPGLTSLFVYRLLSNIYLSALTLPDTFTLNTIEVQVAQPMWQTYDLRFVWNYDLSTESLIVFCLNMLVVLVGIGMAVRRFGIAGLSGVIIFLGYHTVNALAASTGGRYLEPVNWVVLLYYGLGLFCLARLALRCISRNCDCRDEKTENAPMPDQRDGRNKKYQTGMTLGLMALFFIAGLGLLAVNSMAGSLPPETSQSAVDRAFERLHTATGISQQQWQDFLASPNSMVIEGVGYDPMYFTNDIYASDQDSLELLVLGQDHVITSYLLNGEVTQPFRDGSQVILVGCRQMEGDLWGAAHIVMRSIAVIQMDNEGNTIVDMQTDWSCE